MNLENILIDLINQYGLLALLASFGVGILTSLAPCSILTLPLLVGSALGLSGKMDPKEKKIFIFWYSALFVLGLVVSFSILMLLVSKMGMMLAVAPFWAYLLAAIAIFVVISYTLGFIGGIDKDKIAKRFLSYKLFGAFIIGIIFGLVSTPCASAPLVAIVSVATVSSWLYSYTLVLAFAFGHGILLLLAGTSLSFTQSVSSNKKIRVISNALNKFFIAVLFVLAFYFLYQSYIVF
jgi:cytochrome c biogenesis protein CcdA